MLSPYASREKNTRYENDLFRCTVLYDYADDSRTTVLGIWYGH